MRSVRETDLIGRLRLQLLEDLLRLCLGRETHSYCVTVSVEKVLKRRFVGVKLSCDSNATECAKYCRLGFVVNSCSYDVSRLAVGPINPDVPSRLVFGKTRD